MGYRQPDNTIPSEHRSPLTTTDLNRVVIRDLSVRKNEHGDYAVYGETCNAFTDTVSPPFTLGIRGQCLCSTNESTLTEIITIDVVNPELSTCHYDLDLRTTSSRARNSYVGVITGFDYIQPDQLITAIEEFNRLDPYARVAVEANMQPGVAILTNVKLALEEGTLLFSGSPTGLGELSDKPAEWLLGTTGAVTTAGGFELSYIRHIERHPV